MDTNVMMCEKSSCAPAGLFAAVRYKALDFVFETNTSLKVTMTLLALPTPYLTGTSDLYPHSGQLPDNTYRTPWVRGKVVSSCKLVVGSSVLEDLGGKIQPPRSPERYNVKNDVEVIPSSNPDSVKDFNQDQRDCLLKEPQINHPCQETFYKWTAEQIEPEKKSKDLVLPVELIASDHLPHMKRHLPKLKAKLSRLGTFPVADPLLSSTGLVISEDSMFSCFRRCSSYEKPPDVDTTDTQTFAFLQEEFVKELVPDGELLLLPAVVETLQPKLQNFTVFSSICGHVNVHPEPLKEESSVLDVLHNNAFFSTVDIFQYDLTQDHRNKCRLTGGLIESEFAGHLVPSAEMELDFILSQTSKDSLAHISLSTSEFQKEEWSSFSRLSLVSAGTRAEMEALLLKAEKHPTSVVSLLLSEPRKKESGVDFQPLREALTVIKLETDGFSCSGNKLELQVKMGTPHEFLGSSFEFTESMKSEVPPTKEEGMEEFRKLLPEDVEDSAILLDPANKVDLYKDSTENLSQNALQTLVNINNKKENPSLITTEDKAYKQSSPHRNYTNMGNDSSKTGWSAPKFEMVRSSRQKAIDDHRSPVLKRRQPEKDLDPLCSFMILRSQQALEVAVTPLSPDITAGTEVNQQKTQMEPQPPPEQTQTPDKTRANVNIAGSVDAPREQKRTAQWTSQLISRHVSPERQSSRVIQVQATDSQQRAYRELLAFAQPCLSSARELGLSFPSWGDFSCLAPDQTHFLLKQQERAFCRTQAQNVEMVRDQEGLFNQAALIHMLVTFKELLLKCDLSTAVVYLTKAAKLSAEQSLKQLLKKLKIILYLSKMNQESNFKLLQLQLFLSEWLGCRKGNTAEKVLVMLSADSDESRSIIMNSLKQVIAAAVVCPEDDEKKLNGAKVVSSVRDTDCVLVYEQHIGPDFPWSCFSLVVEFDHPGQSPWSTHCSERSINHLTFDTTIYDTDTEQSSWCLEDNMPCALLVTEGLLNCPLLLQTLESSLNVAVLERSHCPTLQMLGGIQNYAVITVDESTAIIIQKEEELCQERASEELVMRLTALSLQYSCCWLILHCPDNRGGGFSSEAFSNLVLIYSSLVLFGMKSEDLDVKVLIVSDVLEVAKKIKQICFTTLMSSDRDPLTYLDRDWLVVTPSQEEVCLSQFPSINPLVGQLMLSRAPSLQWLLGAPLTQLEELFPEVPHKVLKLFSDTTSLYSTSADPQNTRSAITETQQQSGSSQSPLTHTGECKEVNSLGPEPLFSEHNSFLFGAANSKGAFFEQDSEATDFKLDLSPSFGSPDVNLQRSSALWTEEQKRPSFRSKAGAVGRVVERVNDDWTLTASPDNFTSYLRAAESPLRLDSTFSYSTTVQHAGSEFPPLSLAYDNSQPPQSHHRTWTSSSFTGVSWGQDQIGKDRLSRDGGMTAAAANYGFRRWTGQERKRGEEATGLIESVLTPTKKVKLSYERVPGRSDGQTRLRLF